MADRNPILPPVSDSLVQFDPESLTQKDLDQQVEINGAQSTASAAAKQAAINQTNITNIINGTTPVPIGHYVTPVLPTGKWQGPSGNIAGAATAISSTTTSVYRRIMFVPLVVPVGITVDAIGIACNVNGTGTVRVGLYDEVDGRPDTLLVDAGVITLTTAASDLIATFTPLELPAGRYYMACVFQNGSGSIFAWSTAPAGQILYGNTVQLASRAGMGSPAYRTSANTYTSTLPANTTNGTILASDNNTTYVGFAPVIAVRGA